MNEIEFSISLVATEPFDLHIQKELKIIFDELKPYNAIIEPLEVEDVPNKLKKSGEMDILIGSVRVMLPIGAFVPVLIAFLKNYFDARKKRHLQIKRKDGTIIQISGYNGTETKELLKSFTETEQLSSNANVNYLIDQK